MNIKDRNKDELIDYGQYTTIGLKINKDLYNMYINVGFIVGKHLRSGYQTVFKGEGAKLLSNTQYCNSTFYAVPTGDLLVLDVDDLGDFERLLADYGITPPLPNGHTSTGNPRFYCKKPYDLKVPMKFKKYPQIEFLNNRNKYVNCLGQFMEGKVKGTKVKEGATGIYTFNHLDLWDITEWLGQLMADTEEVCKTPTDNGDVDPLLQIANDDDTERLRKTNDNKSKDEIKGELISCLKVISSDVDNDDWIKIIYGIARCDLPNGVLFDIAVRWSSTSPRFDEIETPNRIRALFREKEGAINFGTIVYTAKMSKKNLIVEQLNNGVTLEELKPLLTSFPHITEEDKREMEEFYEGEDSPFEIILTGDKGLVQYKQNFISKISLLTIDEQSEILNTTFERFFLMHDKLRYLSDSNEVVTITQKGVFVSKFIDMFSRQYDNFFEYDSEKEKYIPQMNIDRVYIHLMTERPYHYIENINDLYAPTSRVELNHKTSTATIIDNKLYMTKPKFKGSAVELKQCKSVYDEVIEDYKDHFPQLDEVLGFFVACRFTTDRQYSHLNLRVKSRWGKSAFIEILTQIIKVGVEVSYEDIFENQRSSIQPNEFKRAMVVIIDEFTKFTPKLKEWDSRRAFAAKSQHRETVELYAKMYLSANKSSSFEGSVSPQVRNRLINIDMGGESSMMRMVDRPVFKQHSKFYGYCTQRYIYRAMMAHIKYYLSISQLEASFQGSAYLTAMWEKYKIDESQSINHYAKDELLPLFEKYVRASVADFTNDNVIEVIRGKHKSKSHTHTYFVRGYTRVLQDIIKDNLDTDVAKSLAHNKGELPEMMGLKKLEQILQSSTGADVPYKRGLLVHINQ